MASYQLRCELVAGAPLAEVFPLFENPYNLAKITPPWLNFRVLTEGLEMKQGLRIDYRIGLLGVPMRWRSAITEYDPPRGFVDEALVSPYKRWHHRHTFAEIDGGTRVGDVVNYELPFGPLGAVAHAVMVRRQLMAIFRYRQRKIGELLGGRVLSAPEPVISAK